MAGIWVRNAGSWTSFTPIQPRVRNGSLWSPIKRLWAATQAFDTGTPPQLVTTWHLVWDWTTPANQVPGVSISGGLGVGTPHVDVTWTVNTNPNTDEYTYRVDVEFYTGGTLIDSFSVAQDTGTVETTNVSSGQFVMAKVWYKNGFNGNRGPEYDTGTVAA